MSTTTIIKQQQQGQSYVLLTVDHRRRKQVTEELKRVNDVHSISQVLGRFDLVLSVNAMNPDQKYELVQRIKAIPGVRATNAPQTYEGFNTVVAAAPVKTATMPDDEQRAYCLLGVSRPLPEVMKSLKAFPAITEAYAIGGDYFDIIVSLTGKTHKDLIRSVVDDLGKIEGIRTTETLFAFEEPHVIAA
jgi:DNA-binding Lrp family transcriptional regulator